MATRSFAELVAGAWSGCLTLLFAVEYVLRLICVGRPLHYALSFYGIVDLLAILPGLLSLWALTESTRASSLMAIRGLRLLRVFRVLKLAQYLDGGSDAVDFLETNPRQDHRFLFVRDDRPFC